MNNTLVIIPAKVHSERVLNKNMRHIDGIPLFVHSINYAKQEGFKHIAVSSDGEHILKIAKSLGCIPVKENVNESKLEYCVNQVLAQEKGYRYFALLQPTSPLREKDKLKSMLARMKNEELETLLTCQQIKPVAWLDQYCLFDVQNRPLSQQAKSWIYHFDGNILLRNIESYKKEQILIPQVSGIEVNAFPYYLQIDTIEEFNQIKMYVEKNTEKR
ncbi:MAG TPA: hypothetical protein GXZ87_07705 [Bacteroidales bacterium]|nr:hypothetical protein [Bacteroidales bacterium]